MTKQFTDRSKHAMSDRYNICRDICVDQFEKRTKMDDTGIEVQIDESLFQVQPKSSTSRRT